MMLVKKRVINLYSYHHSDNVFAYMFSEVLAFNTIIYEHSNLLPFAASRRNFLYILGGWVSRD